MGRRRGRDVPRRRRRPGRHVPTRRRDETITARRLVILLVAAGLVAFVVDRAIRRASSGAEAPAPAVGRVADPDVAAAIDKAIADARASPRSANAWAALAMTYDANELSDLAETCYREAVRLSPGEPSWWYDLAVVLEREDKFDDASVALGRAAALDSSYPPLHYSAAVWALARGRLDDSEVAANRTLETSRGAAGGYIAVGRVHLERGRDAEAAKAFQRALETWPKDWGDPAYPKFLLGTALSRLGRSA